MQRAWAAAVVSLVALVFVTVSVAAAYRVAVQDGCNRECSACCGADTPAIYEDCTAVPCAKDGRFSEPSSDNGWFFAMQTVTTTGYGSYVFAKFPRVQNIATWGMALGNICWAIFLGAIVSIMTTPRTSDGPH